MTILNAGDVFNKQYENYLLIHNYANAEIRKKLNMLDKLTDYKGLTDIKNKNEIDKKKKTFVANEKLIIQVKKDTINQETRLNELIKNIKKEIAAVKEQERINYHMNNKNLSIK